MTQTKSLLVNFNPAPSVQGKDFDVLSLYSICSTLLVAKWIFEKTKLGYDLVIKMIERYKLINDYYRIFNL